MSYPQYAFSASSKQIFCAPNYGIAPYDPLANPYEIWDSNQAYSPIPSENLSICYAQELYLINDRLDFVSNQCFAAHTQIWNITTDRFIKGQYRDFADRKVLVVVHGFTTSNDDMIHTIRALAKQLLVYDTIIGYSYPTEDAKGNIFEMPQRYHAARSNALKAAKFSLPYILEQISSHARSFDLLAHSMGAFTAFQALNQPNFKINIQNFFSVGGALGDKHLVQNETNQLYPLATKRIQEIVIIYSCNDLTLLGHTLLIGENTIGRLDNLQKNLGKNVKLINATAVVNSHTDYFLNSTILHMLETLTLKSDQQLCLSGRFYSLKKSGLTREERASFCHVPTDVHRVMRNGIDQVMTDWINTTLKNIDI